MARTADIMFTTKPVAPCHVDRNYSGARNRHARADSYPQSRNELYDDTYKEKFVRERDMRRPGADSDVDDAVIDIDRPPVRSSRRSYTPFTTESRDFKLRPQLEIERNANLQMFGPKPKYDAMNRCVNTARRRRR